MTPKQHLTYRDADPTIRARLPAGSAGDRANGLLAPKNKFFGRVEMLRFPRLFGVLAAVSALGIGAAAADESGPVKLGVLTDMSGPYSELSGQGSVEAALLAIEDMGGSVLGQPVELVVGDHLHKPDVGLAIARRWYDEEGVDAILDVANSAIALGVSSLAAEKHKMALFASAATERLTEDLCNGYGLKWGSDTYSQTFGGVKSAIAAGNDTWFIMAGDYEFGHTMQAAIEQAVKDNGGTVVGSVRFPVGTLDFSSFLLQAQGSGAKMINLIAGGTDTINAVKQANEFGVFAGGQKMSNPVVYLTDVHAAGLAQMAGMQVVVPFYWDYDDQTRAFAKRFYDKLGKMPSEPQGAVYGSVLDYLRAVEAAGTKDPDKVIAKLMEMDLENAFTRNGHLAKNGRVWHDMYLAEVKTPEESTGPWDYYKILALIPADQAFRPADQSKCPLLAN